MSSVDGLNGGRVSSRENNEIRLGLGAVRYILTLCSDLERRLIFTMSPKDQNSIRIHCKCVETPFLVITTQVSLEPIVRTLTSPRTSPPVPTTHITPLLVHELAYDVAVYRLGAHVALVKVVLGRHVICTFASRTASLVC